MADSDNPVGRSRARARGRARGQKPPEPARRPTDVIAITTPASQFPAVVRPPVSQPPQPAGAGRALHRGGVTSEARLDGAAAAASVQAITTGMEAVTVGQPGGRGAMRGRPPAKDEVHCRPPSCVDKRGTDLLTNYAKVTSAFGSDFIFYQYRVDFSPSIESSKMLFDHLDVIGRSFVFDGMEDLKTTTTRLPKDELILWSKCTTYDENIQITVKHTGELNGRHPEVLRLTNTQQRKNFLHMGFVAMGRNMFDKEAALPIEQYKIELWPGVLTAIRVYENSLLMVVDVIHKVVVLQQLRQRYARDKNNYLQNCSKELAGCIVNKTYSLDDFDSTKCPTDTFETRKTALISYVEDYKKQYDITISDLQPKERDFRSDAKDVVYLIPQLCVMTGLTDIMRSHFNLMREVATTTRPGPRSRVEMVKSFMNRCLTNAKVKEDMEKWGISYGSEPLQLQEKIIQGRSEFSAKDRDFGKDNPRHMDKFAIISTERDRPNCDELYETFKMNVAAPKIMSVSDDRTTSFLNEIKEAFKMGATLIVAIVPNNKEDRYDAIKKLCCIECPDPTELCVYYCYYYEAIFGLEVNAQQVVKNAIKQLLRTDIRDVNKMTEYLQLDHEARKKLNARCQELETNFEIVQDENKALLLEREELLQDASTVAGKLLQQKNRRLHCLQEEVFHLENAIYEYKAEVQVLRKELTNLQLKNVKNQGIAIQDWKKMILHFLNSKFRIVLWKRGVRRKAHCVWTRSL